MRYSESDLRALRPVAHDDGTLDLYRSHFRAPWRGVAIAGRTDIEHVYWFVILWDRHGNPLKERRLKSLSLGWVEKIGTINVCDINPDWLIMPGRT